MKLIRSLYRFLSSRGLAVVLLIAIAGVALIGSVVAQLSAAGVHWAAPGHTLNPVIRILHLNDLFQAWWALALVAALAINLLLCTIARMRRPLPQPDQIRGLLHFRQLATTMPIDESWLMIEEEMRSHRFSIRSRKRMGSVVWAARRNRLGTAFSILFHLSLLVALAGFILRAKRGFEGEMVLFPDQTGEIQATGSDTIQVQLVSSGADYDLAPHGDGLLLRQRRSELILYENRRFERSAGLDINHPIPIRGITVFQSDPVQMFVVRLTPINSRRSPPDDEKHKDTKTQRDVRIHDPEHQDAKAPTAAKQTLLAASGGIRSRGETNRPKPFRDTLIHVRENEVFELGDAGSRLRLSFSPAPLGSLFRNDSLYSRLPVQAVLERMIPSESGRSRAQLLDTIRLEQPISIGNHIVSLLNIRQGTRIGYRYDPALPWFFSAGAIFLISLLLRGFMPAWELSGSVTEEGGVTIVRLGGRALGLFTSLRPLVNRIVDRFEGSEE